MGMVLRGFAAIVMLTALLLPTSVSSTPYGVGNEANEGCLCHTPMAETKLSVDGFPSKYEANTTYEMTLSISSPVGIEANQSQGGFRMTVSNGTLLFNDTEAQEMDGGWTHLENGTYQRSWDFSWTSPDDNSSRTEFTVHGNAVNGNGLQTGDGWSTYSIVLPGVEHDGDLAERAGLNGLGTYDKVLLLVGLCALVGMLWSVNRS